MAQRKRVGLITQRSEDRNLPSLLFWWRNMFSQCCEFYRRTMYNSSEVAQRKRVGLITQRSEDRNLPSLLFGWNFIFLYDEKWKKFPNRELNPGLSGESRVSWPPRLLGSWLCFRPGSNRRPWDYETHALPTAPRKLMWLSFNDTNIFRFSGRAV